jgi:hypothetical protein
MILAPLTDDSVLPVSYAAYSTALTKIIWIGLRANDARWFGLGAGIDETHVRVCEKWC